MLSTKEINAIYKLRHEGYSTIDIAKLFKISKVTAYHIVTGKTYKDLYAKNTLKLPEGRITPINNRGAQNPKAKLTYAQVITIRRLKEEGTPIKEIKALFKISTTTVYDLTNGRTWN
jgi:transposase